MLTDKCNSSQYDNNKSLGTGSIVGIVIPGLATVTLVYYLSKTTAQGEELNQVEVDGVGGHKHMITYQRILKVTEESSDNHLIGCGSFDRVYQFLLR
ncbi:hypothetical protein SUGI_0411870 [Cryptomeria japonica]|nr:hypothetical protein SUGI_0411870 [Cryptomeria japonica]